jgi:hypothetical protein
MADFNPAIKKACGESCPPKDAKAVTLKIFRGIRSPPLTADDFLSHAELGLPCDPANCEHWGLSVWLTERAVHHARGTYRPIRRWHIAAGTITPQDGVLMATPTTPQPEHHTFWKVFGKDISGSFTIVIVPENS